MKDGIMKSKFNLGITVVDTNNYKFRSESLRKTCLTLLDQLPGTRAKTSSIA